MKIANSPAFCGNKIKKAKEKIKEVEITRDNILEGSVGAGGAVAITKGGKYLTTLNMLRKKTQPIIDEAGNIIKNTPSFFGRMKNFFTVSFEGLKNARFLKPLANLAQTKPAKMVFGAFSGLSAVAVCATELSHTVNTGAKVFENGFNLRA